jgi:hypothetical protein
MVLKILLKKTSEGKEIKDIYIGKEDVKPALLAEHLIFYVKDSKESI